MASSEVRVVAVRPRTIFLVLGITVLVGLSLVLVLLAWHVLTWILIAALLAAALNPAVESFERRGLRRGYAATIVFAIALLVLTGIGFLVIPPLVSQVTDFVNTVPDFIDDITAGRGPLGWLQDDYQIVDRIRDAIERQGVGGVLGLSEPVLEVVRSVVTAVVGTITPWSGTGFSPVMSLATGGRSGRSTGVRRKNHRETAARSRSSAPRPRRSGRSRRQARARKVIRGTET